MYYEYFGFKQPPFRITPDTSLFYPGGDRGAILDALLYAILNGEGIVKVVGEVGSGKTMLCRMLEKELPDRVEVVYLVNPSISPENTLHAIAFELKLDVNTQTSRFEVMNALQQYLLRRHSENRQVVIFVEEAQSMPIATLEEIRLLSNLETQQSKLLQIVLFGQPELDTMIAQPEIRQLKERITYSFQLAPFKTNDIREYINTRVRACGYRSAELFSDAAIRQIEQHSRGLLRRVNILADKSLLAAFADNKHRVELRHTRMAARDSEFLPRSVWSPKTLLVAGTVAAVLLVVVLLLLYTKQPATPVAAAQVPEIPSQSSAGTISPEIPAESSSPVETAAPQQVLSSIPAEDPIEPAMAVPASEPIAVPAEHDTAVPLEGDPVVKVSETPAEASAAENDSPVVVSSPNDAGSEKIEEVNEQKMLLEGDNPHSIAPGKPPGQQSSTPENQLLGMSAVYQLQGMGNDNLTAGEVKILQNQLIRLPPESVESQEQTDESGLCRQCWSIIYRPLPISKNL